MAACAFTASAACVEVVDNCATLLGSLSRELRYARALPPGTQSSFACPREREVRAVLGASRQRVLNALGTPDRNTHGDDGAVVWTYVFRSKLQTGQDRGVPELSFRFDAMEQIAAVDCERSR